MSNREKILRQELARILEILVKEYSPIKIILFGSLAEGKVGDWSDIDLAIIKVTKDRFLDRIGEVMMLIRPKVACDVVVYTPREFAQMLKEGNHFIGEEIQKRGKVLYETGK